MKKLQIVLLVLFLMCTSCAYYMTDNVETNTKRTEVTAEAVNLVVEVAKAIKDSNPTSYAGVLLAIVNLVDLAMRSKSTSDASYFDGNYVGNAICAIGSRRPCKDSHIEFDVRNGELSGWSVMVDSGKVLTITGYVDDGIIVVKKVAEYEAGGTMIENVAIGSWWKDGGWFGTWRVEKQ